MNFTNTAKRNADVKLWSVYLHDKENINPQTGELARSRIASKTAFNRRPLQEIDTKTLLPTNIMTSARVSNATNPNTEKSVTKKVFYR